MGKQENIFSGQINRAWISMETMGHHLLVILNSMENHGKHGTAFSYDFRQHRKAWGASLLIFMTLNSMEKLGKQGTALLMISNSMEKHGEHGNPFFHELR